MLDKVYQDLSCLLYNPGTTDRVAAWAREGHECIIGRLKQFRVLLKPFHHSFVKLAIFLSSYFDCPIETIT